MTCFIFSAEELSTGIEESFCKC